MSFSFPLAYLSFEGYYFLPYKNSLSFKFALKTRKNLFIHLQS